MKRTQSLNFYTAIITLITSLLIYNNIDTNGLNDIALDVSQNGFNAVLLALPNLLTIVIKTIEKIQARQFKWREYLISKNFGTQLIVLAVSSLLLFDVVTVEASVSIATTAHAINTAIHIRQDGFLNQKKAYENDI